MSDNTTPVPEVQPPDPAVAAEQAAKAAACAALEKCKVSKADAQKSSGQLPEHFEANCKTAQESNTALAFRDSNPACQPHIQGGVQSKPVDIKDKTAKSGPESGLVHDAEGGLVTKNGGPVTGDYDLHDMIGMDGVGSIPGGSAAEAAMIDKLNGNMGQALPGATDPMVNHGPWTEWDKVKAGQAPATALPATAIVPNKQTGTPDFYQLKTPEDHANFRKCIG